MVDKKNKKLFTNFITNFIICAVICTLALSASNTVISVMNAGNKPYYNGNGDSVSLMINVYWGTEYIEPMLDVLDQYSVKATFFIGGTWAEKNMELVALIAIRGHEIGNHGYLHRDHKKLTVRENHEEIVITSRLLTNITGQEINLFAPPSGSFGNNVFLVCEELNYKVIMWSKDTIDWRDKDADLVFTRATKNIQKGDFVLMHPTAHTLEAMPRILNYYKSNSIKTSTVTTNIIGNTY